MGALKLVLLSGESLFPNHVTVHPDDETAFLAVEDIATIPKSNDPESVVLHLAMLREHVRQLKKRFPVSHYQYYDQCSPKWNKAFEEALDDHHVGTVCIYESCLNLPLQHILEVCERRNIRVEFFTSPRYILQRTCLQHVPADEAANFSKFYIHLRKELRILVDEHGVPIESEKEVPERARNQEKHYLPVFEPNNETLALRRKLGTSFPRLADQLADFNQAVSRNEALKLLDCFIKHHLHEVPRPKSIAQARKALNKLPIGAHINAGIILPLEVLHRTVALGSRFDLPFEQVENFVRLILGWREFIRMDFELQYPQIQSGHTA